MRLTGTTGVLASLIAVCAATPTPAEASVKAFPSTPADGDWHIGCDTNKHCSYYQDSAVASGADAPVLFRRAALSSTTCTECTAETPCSECLGSNFLCYSCEHWECYDEIIGEAICLDVAPELAESIRNSTSTALASSIATSTSTVLATYTATSTSTTVTTSTSTATSTFTLSSSFAEITTTSTSVEVATTIITVLPSVTTSVPTVITITVDPSELPGSTYTVLPQGQGNLARRDGDDAAQTSNTDPLPVRRHAAFKQSQCTPCGPGDCPSCYMDCDDCEHFLCNDMATYLTVCMSVRSQWQPPSLNISAYGSDLYTTVVAMAQASTLTTTATIMVASAPPSPSASTSTSTSTVFAVSPPALSSGPSTVFVFPSVPSISTSTEFAVPQVPSVSTVLEPSFTTVFAVPQVPSVSTVFAVPQATQLTTITLPVPALPSVSTSTVFALPPATQLTTITMPVPAPPSVSVSTVFAVPQETQLTTITMPVPAPPSVSISTVFAVPQETQLTTITMPVPALPSVGISTVFVVPSSSIIQNTELIIPVTMVSTLTKTLDKVRAAQTAAPVSSRNNALVAECETCTANPDCEVCDVFCTECEQLICGHPITGETLCVTVAPDANEAIAEKISESSDGFLGHAGSLLIRDDGEEDDSSSVDGPSQPPVANGDPPYFQFNDAECIDCGLDDEACGDCDWQFICGLKKKCFYNGAREVVELCYEMGEKCIA